VLLPVEHETEKAQSSALLAVDASGSIPQRVLERLLEVARGVPRDRLILSAISFDTNVYPLDIWARPPGIRGGGGTSFDAVEQFALHLPLYPDLVVVLTDGHAPRPTVRYRDRWFWLLTPTGTSAHVEGVGRYCRIEDLVLNHSVGHP
jgi:predicted metal-dependent peptidase